MNTQGTPLNPLGGIEWTHIFGPMTGYTANPIRGCQHKCRWRMPDGKIVVCYAETAYERIHGKDTFQRITVHQPIIDEISRRRKPSGIFIDSMSDLFQRGVSDGDIQKVIDVMVRCRQHIFFVLTKNPSRLVKFQFPNNVAVGISAPPTFINGKQMLPTAQKTWFSKGAEWLHKCSAKNKWFSLEPLAIDVSDTVMAHKKNICWSVIGAGSDGSATYQPDKSVLESMLAALEGNPVFFKGNICKTLAEQTGGWRQEFPSVDRFKIAVQNELF